MLFIFMVFLIKNLLFIWKEELMNYILIKQ